MKNILFIIVTVITFLLSLKSFKAFLNNSSESVIMDIDESFPLKKLFGSKYQKMKNLIWSLILLIISILMMISLSQH